MCNKSVLHNKRVSLVIADLGKGGAQRVALDLCLALQNRFCCKVQLITFSKATDDQLTVPSNLKRSSLCLQQENRGIASKALALGKRLCALRRAVVDYDSDLVIAFTGSTNIEAILAMAGSQIPVIISERNDPSHQSLGIIWDHMRRIFYKRAALVTANSPAAIESLANFVPTNKLHRVYNPLPPNSIDTNPIVRNSKRLLAVGRLHPQKGYDDLIASFAASDLPSKEWQLDILGDGPLFDQLHAQSVALGVEHLVHFHGWQPDPRPWYLEASLFIMPSRYEGSPNALIEAMQFGLWCITSDASGCSELIDHGTTGTIVPIGNRNQLTSAMNARSREVFPPEVVDHSSALERFEPSKAYTVWENVIAEVLTK